MANRSSSSNKKRDDRVEESTAMELEISPRELEAVENYRYFNVDDSPLSPSPRSFRPRLFQSGTIFNSATYEQVFSSVYQTQEKSDGDEKDEKDDKDEGDTAAVDQRADLHEVLYRARETELNALATAAVSQRPADDETTEFILNELGLRSETRRAHETAQDTSVSLISGRSYPPVNQTGPVGDHDRPFAEFGHLDRESLARQYNFNLQQPISGQSTPARFHAKSFAIVAYTRVPKEDVMANITNQFGIDNLQYICISEGVNESSQQSCLQIQIVFKEKIDRRKPFLDDVTRTRCNYQVTSNDLAWNEYIKKEGNYSEFGDFKSTKNHGQREWPSQSVLSVDSAVATPAAILLRPPATTTTAARPIAVPKLTTVRAQAEERRQRDDELARQALTLAETSIDQAMDLLRRVMPNKFLHHSKWYLEAFKYVHLRRQHEADSAGTIDKEYVWPDSFDCTPRLKEAIDRWIKHHFYRVKRAKCLVLIGPTGTGKTSFAMSLPGQVNYFQGRWNLDNWSDYARYSVYDDVPWDDFDKWNYPPMKSLLTQNGKLNVTDKYRTSMSINVRQPAIVLMNPENAGSLLATPTTVGAQKWAEYWRKRATVYVMDADEYFYRRRANAGQNSSNSTSSSMSIHEPRLDPADEFDVTMARAHGLDRR